MKNTLEWNISTEKCLDRKLLSLDFVYTTDSILTLFNPLHILNHWLKFFEGFETLPMVFSNTDRPKERINGFPTFLS